MGYLQEGCSTIDKLFHRSVRCWETFSFHGVAGKPRFAVFSRKKIKDFLNPLCGRLKLRRRLGLLLVAVGRGWGNFLFHEGSA